MEKAVDPVRDCSVLVLTVRFVGRVLDLSELQFIHLQNALTSCFNLVNAA